MKIFAFIVFAILVDIFSVEANSVIYIDLATNDKGPSYTVNSIQMALSEIGPWMKQSIEKFGDTDPVSIFPDKQSSFDTLYTLLEILKLSGLKSVSVVAERSLSQDTTTIRSVLINLESVKTDKFTRGAAVFQLPHAE